MGEMIATQHRLNLNTSLWLAI